MTRQEKIREAYGEHFETVKDYLNEDGRLRITDCKKIGNLPVNFEVLDTYYVRPKSLAGIENNNGWVKIENEDDLPKENIDCLICFSNNEIKCDRFLVNHKNFIKNHYKYITHYQPIIKPKPPIY